MTLVVGAANFRGSDIFENGKLATDLFIPASLDIIYHIIIYHVVSCHIISFGFKYLLADSSGAVPGDNRWNHPGLRYS